MGVCFHSAKCSTKCTRVTWYHDHLFQSILAATSPWAQEWSHHPLQTESGESVYSWHHLHNRTTIRHSVHYWGPYTVHCVQLFCEGSHYQWDWQLLFWTLSSDTWRQLGTAIPYYNLIPSPLFPTCSPVKAPPLCGPHRAESHKYYSYLESSRM